MVATAPKTLIDPVSNYIVCAPITEDQTESGLVIPKSAQKSMEDSNLKRGRILRVGPGKKNEKGERQEMEFAVGQIIVPIGPVLQFQEHGDDRWLITEEMVCGVERLEGEAKYEPHALHD